MRPLGAKLFFCFNGFNCSFQLGTHCVGFSDMQTPEGPSAMQTNTYFDFPHSFLS